MALSLMNHMKKKTSGRTVPIEEHHKLKGWYAEMLRRKDTEIDELKQTNKILMKTALRRAAENDDLKAAVAELRERMSKKNSK